MVSFPLFTVLLLKYNLLLRSGILYLKQFNSSHTKVSVPNICHFQQQMHNLLLFSVMNFQEGCKGLLYMVLHARVVLDLCEHLEKEITFEQVEGDFDSFQGRWLLEQLGNHHTLLKYSVDSKMQQNSLLSEAIMEEVCKLLLF